MSESTHWAGLSAVNIQPQRVVPATPQHPRPGVPVLMGAPRRHESGTFRIEWDKRPAAVAPAVESPPLADAEASVRAWLREHLQEGPPTLGLVARRMGIGKRTLQRRLRAQETSFQDILEEMRRAKFAELAGQRLSADELATALGYSDGRCLRRWRAARALGGRAATAMAEPAMRERAAFAAPASEVFGRALHD